jgi:short-subunit dehydrogenase
VLHYTKSLNHELKKYGIRATCFCPGWVETEFLGKSLANGNKHPKSMKPLLKCETVVKKCVKASIKGRAMFVTGWYTKLQHVLFKLVPDCILTKIWLGMLTGKRKEEK